MPTLVPLGARLLPQAGPAAVFVSAWAFRFLAMGSVENDHFVALARAHQILHGAWPVRDFFDPGQPLAYLTSAVLAAIVGPSLLTEVLLATTMLALAASVTFALAHRASGSGLIALAAAAAEVAAYPRLYNAGKLLIPIVAIWFAWRYADRASVARLAALAGWTAIAFLWRHDLGMFVAVPSLVLLFYHHAATALFRRRLVQYLLLCVAFLLPWMAYVQWAAGLDVYLASASRFVAVEARRTGRPDHIAFVCLAAAIPLIAIGFAKRLASPLTFAHIAFVATMALSIDIVFLRDALAARLPDVAGVSLVLLAWLAGRAPEAVARVTALAAAAAAATGVVVMLAKQGYGIPTAGGIVRRAATIVDHLNRASAEAVPDPELLPIVDYVALCTRSTERVFVSGFAPQLAVLANRPFAAGLPTWLAGYYTSDADVARARATLSRESVSLVVLLEGEEAFTTEWPGLAADLRARGLVQRTWALGDRTVTVWLPASRAQVECKNEWDRLHKAVSRP